MIVEVICNGEFINVCRDGNKPAKGVHGNPFGEQLPIIGDYIRLGEHKIDAYEKVSMKKYLVKSRTFSAIADYNHSYSDKKCVIEVEEAN